MVHQRVLLEKRFQDSQTLHIKVAGNKAVAAALIGASDGVKEITEAEDEGNNITSFTVQLSGKAEQVQDRLASEFLNNQLSILEIYADRPNLEKVFSELISRPVQKKSIEELMNEIVPESVNADSEEENEKEDK